MKTASAFATLAALFSMAACGDDTDRPAERSAAADNVKPTPHLPSGRGYVLARVRKAVLVHDRPGGRPIARLRRTTPFGEPRTLGVHETREEGKWLGIHTPVLGNKRTGWIENSSRVALTRTLVSLRIDLSKKRVALRRGRRTVRRFPIAIGSAGTSTPAGRFQVTDKLPASRFPAGAYGCCILALSAKQPNLPPGWPGGNRIAIHGTPFDETIGSASSNGCLRATDADLRVLMRDVPVGTPVFIRR